MVVMCVRAGLCLLSRLLLRMHGFFSRVLSMSVLSSCWIGMAWLDAGLCCYVSIYLESMSLRCAVHGAVLRLTSVLTPC